jgi:PEGA domain.
LEPRKYNLRIMSPGYEPVETSVDFRRKQLPDLPPFRLVRSKGALQIQSEPPGAQFSLRSEDGQVSREGVTPQTVADLPTGKYSIVARHDDWEMRGDVDVQRGDTANKSFAFVRALTNITSEPGGAEIFVEDNRGGARRSVWICPRVRTNWSRIWTGGLTNSKGLTSSRNETTQRILCSQMAA